MTTLKEKFPCKVLAISLCVLIIGVEAQVAFSQQETPLARFATARQVFGEGDFGTAKTNLETLIRQVDEKRPENREFLGNAYALLGASEEMLKETDPANAHYLKAKELLGGKHPALDEVSRLDLPLFEQAFGPVRPTSGPDLAARFDAAERAYKAGAYGEARIILEGLVADLSVVPGREGLMGQTCLLAGATYEKLNRKGTAVDYYCRAKDILGEGRTFSGLDLTKLRWYGERCPGQAMAVAGEAAPVRAGRGSESMSRFLKILLIATGVGIAVWYLAFSKNSPFKKGVKSGTYSSSCFTSYWSFSYYAKYAPGSGGTVTISPNPEQAFPQPTENNGWEDQVTYTVTATNADQLTDFYFKFDIEVGGGDNQKRRDIVSVDGVVVLDVTNQFSESCSSPGKVKYDNVYVKTSPGMLTVKHKVEISKTAAIGVSSRLAAR